MAKIPTMDEMAKQLAEKTLDEVYYNDKSLREWMKIIASEDAISRKAVLEWIKGSLEQYANTYSNDMLNMWMLFEEQIKALPPIQPHVYQWIEHIDRDDYDDSEELWYECPCCNGKHYRDSKYCPDCGAKMEVE